MELFSVLVFALLCNGALLETLPCECGIENGQTRIVGGEVTSSNAYPWMALIRIQNVEGEISHCGGAIINDRYILTATHCFFFTRKILVSVGTNKYPDNLSDFIEINDWITHDDYDPSLRLHDIALLETKEPLKFSRTVRPVCLPRKGQIASGNFTVAGWGQTEAGVMSKDLMHVEITESDIKKCNETYENVLGPTHICAGIINKTSCYGDSGGPLMQKSNGKVNVVATVSFGSEVCGTTESIVYTRVEPHLDWIKENSRAGKYCST